VIGAERVLLVTYMTWLVKLHRLLEHEKHICDPL